MKRIHIDDKLYNTIELFCRENGLDIKEYINSLLLKEFTIEKFGDVPPFFVKSNDTQKKEKEEINTEVVIDDTITTIDETAVIKEEKITEVKPAKPNKKAEAKRRIQKL